MYVYRPILIFYSTTGWISLKSHFFFFFPPVKALFPLSRNVSNQRNRYWCSGRPHAVHEAPLHDLKVSVVCTECVEDNKDYVLQRVSKFQSLSSVNSNTILQGIYKRENGWLLHAGEYHGPYRNFLMMTKRDIFRCSHTFFVA